EEVRLASADGPPLSTTDLCASLRAALAADPARWPPLVRHPVEGGPAGTLFPLRLGLDGELGVLAAGARRAGFPGEADRLVLGVAANQASMAAAIAELKNEVAERRLSEEALAKLRSELAQVGRVMSLGVLTASIAHEVNQPLAGIITNASTCLRML